MTDTPEKTWPEDVTERLTGYAGKHGISLEEAGARFAKWLKAEFEVDAPHSEDPFYLSQWSEQFVIEDRNNVGGGGSSRDTVTYVGMFIGIEDSERDGRKGVFDNALTMFRNNRDRAIDEGLIGILTAKEGLWHINGQPTEDRVKGSDLPWYGFENDDMLLCLMANRDGERKPMAPTSFSRKAYFLGSPESGGDIKAWSINLQGDAMKAQQDAQEAAQRLAIEREKMAVDAQRLQREHELRMAEMQQQFALEREKIAAQMQIESAKIQAENAAAAQKLANEAQIARERLAVDIEMKAHESAERSKERAEQPPQLKEARESTPVVVNIGGKSKTVRVARQADGSMIGSVADDD